MKKFTLCLLNNIFAIDAALSCWGLFPCISYNFFYNNK